MKHTGISQEQHRNQSHTTPGEGGVKQYQVKSFLTNTISSEIIPLTTSASSAVYTSWTVSIPLGSITERQRQQQRDHRCGTNSGMFPIRSKPSIHIEPKSHINQCRRIVF